MPDLPVRTWWFDPIPTIKEKTFGTLAGFAGVFAIELWQRRPSLPVLVVCTVIVLLVRLAANLPPRLACLASGGLVVINSWGTCTHVPMAVADVSVTPKDCQITWGPYAPVRIKLPGFSDADELMAAVETARAEGRPITSPAMAVHLPVAPVLTPWRWVGSIELAFLLVPLLTWATALAGAPGVYGLLPLLALPWIDLPRWRQPWVAVTPEGLWLLRRDEAPRLIPADAITGARRYLWDDCTVRTADPALPVLKLGIRPADLRRVLTTGGAVQP